MVYEDMTDNSVSLDEVDDAIEGSSSIGQLIDNLHNIQRREGGHKQIFRVKTNGNETNLQNIIRNLKEIRMGVDNGLSYHALDPRFEELPNGVREKAREIVKQNM